MKKKILIAFAAICLLATVGGIYLRFSSSTELVFSGQEYPENPKDFLKIISVGAEKLLLDSLMSELLKDYPKLWMNNVGQNKNSTKDYLLLFKDQLLKKKPDYLLFFLGENEVVSDSERIEKQTMSGEELSRLMMFHTKTYLPFYRRRLETLISNCKENNIQAVFIIQTTDSEQLLELYNGVTRIVARKENISLIDLPKLTTKDLKFFDELKKVLKQRKSNQVY